MPMPRTATVTIASSGTTSEASNLGDLCLIALLAPAALTGTAFAFKVSTDNSTFVDLYDEAGTLYSVAIAASRGVPVNGSLFAPWNWVKVVSNAGEGGARTITLVKHPQPTANNRLLAVAAGEAHLGAVGGHLSAVYVTVTRPADTNAYAANDAIADSASAGALASAVLGRTATGNGLIVGLTLQNSNTAATHRMEVDLYNASITAVNDNAEATRLAANKLKFIGTITLPALAKKTASSDQTEASDFTIRVPFQCAADGLIYFMPRTLDAHTPASGTTYTFCFHVAQN